MFSAYGTLAEEFIIRNISISGNSVTKESVILRECEFKTATKTDLCSLEEMISKSRNNLLNTSLFNFADITYTIEDNKIDINIIVTERWYYWIYPILEQADRNLSSYIYYENWEKINYGLAFDKQNFLGLNHLLKFKLRLGYREHYSFYYSAPELGKTKTHGFWAGTDYFRQKQVVADIYQNQATYFSNSDYIFNNRRLEAGYSYRHKFYSVFKLRLMYEDFVFSDSLKLLNPQWEQTGNNHTYIYPQIKYEFDNRDNINYPLSGIKAFINSRLFDFSDNNLRGNILTEAGFELNTKINNYLYYRGSIFGFTGIFTQDDKKSPFYFHNNPNYSHIIRGYEYYYFYSSGFYSFSNTISYILSDYKEHRIPFIKNDKFGKTFTRIYLNAFLDIARTGEYLRSNHTNSMNNRFIASAGLGLALETYYDRVLEIRFAYNEHLNNFGIFVDYKKTILNAF
jgi:hypothetical protein